MRLTTQEMRDRRDCMIHHAFRLFCENGIEAVKMTDIAHTAKFGEKTLYRYFGSKEKLVLEAFIQLWENIMHTVELSVQNTENYPLLTGLEQVSVWVDGFRNLYTTDKDFVLFSYEAKLYLLRHNVRLSKTDQDMMMHSIRGPCLEALRKGKADGSIPAKADCEDLFYAIWGAIRGYVVKIVIYEGLYGAESPWEARYNIVKNGILCALHNGWQVPEEFLPSQATTI